MNIEEMRKKYKKFKRNKEDPISLKSEILLMLQYIEEENIKEELEDMLMEVLFSLDESKCKCEHKCCK